MSGDRLVVLDGWRAISAGIVVLSHMVPSCGVYGQIGVNLFFGISGYIICRNFLREEAEAGAISIRGFYIRRLFRIVPPLLAYVVLIWGLDHFGIVADAGNIWRTLTFSCNFPNADCGGWLGAHTWSLSVEEQFYAIIPFLFLVSMPGARKLLTLFLLGLLPVTVLLLFVLKLRMMAYLLLEFETIAMGVACALNERWLSKIVSRVPVAAILCSAAAIVLIVNFSGSRLATVLHVLGYSPLIVLVLMHSLWSGSAIYRPLCSRPLQVLGACSYSIYLWQEPAMYGFGHVAGGRSFGIPVKIGVIILCVGAALGSYFFMERRLIRVGRSLSRLVTNRAAESRTRQPEPSSEIMSPRRIR